MDQQEAPNGLHPYFFMQPSEGKYHNMQSNVA
jgi:hypothetical protein